MSRVLIASCWILVPLTLCSCVDDTDVRPSPAPIVKSIETDIQIEPSLVHDPSPVKQQAVEPVAENNEPQPVVESAPSSGNPLIDFFRSVDRGVKSTTDSSDGPEPNEPESANKPTDK